MGQASFSQEKLVRGLSTAFTVIFVLGGGVFGQRGENGNVKSGVFALPEIRISLRNRTALQVEPNSPVELSQELGYIELSCTADYPVKWEYLVNNRTIPVLDVVYRRLIRGDVAVSDFSNPKRNRFMSVVILRGLLESQTGKYLCRHYNEKIGSNNYAVSSHFDIFVPGNKTFNTISTVKFANKSDSEVSIHCPVTNPKVQVKLFKLNEKHFNKTEKITWKPIDANYEPTDGFRLVVGLGRELLGTYNCSADNGASLILIVADPSERDLYLSSSPSISVNSSCWENFKFVQYLRSKRLECYCKDSYGLFMNDNYEFENRQASCPLPNLLARMEKCGDWRIEEFFLSEESSRDVCFRGRRTQELLDGSGSGSRPSLQVKGKTFPTGDNQRSFPFTKLSVTYNGFVDWAGDFKLAICRSETFCLLDRDQEQGRLAVGSNPVGARSDNNKTGTPASLEYVKIEPSLRQYFPLAHYQAVWRDFIVNGTDVKLIYVFQAHSLSYDWFPYATGDIEWDSVGREKNWTTTKQSAEKGEFPESGMMMSGGVSSFKTTVNGISLACGMNHFSAIIIMFIMAVIVQSL